MSYILHMFFGLDEVVLSATVAEVGRIDFDGTVTQCSADTDINGVRADTIAGYNPSKNNTIFTDATGFVTQVQFGTDASIAWWRAWKDDQLTEGAVIDALVLAGYKP